MISLTPVCADDEAVLLEIYRSTRVDEMAISGWDPSQQDTFVRIQFAAQQYYYAAAFPNGEHKIILSDGRPIGRIYTAECQDELRILDITVLPSERNKGVGTPLIKDVLARAQALGKPAKVYVETYNPSLRLFERLGFTRIEEDGLNVLLEWSPRK